MNRKTFHEHFRKAAAYSFEVARRLVRNELPASFRYTVHLNASYDGNPLKRGERVFPDDASTYGKTIGPLDDTAVVDLLWRDGLIPEWIDISVERADSEYTYFSLLCCGRFTDSPEHLYYGSTDCCPFGTKSPALPPRWEQGNGPFDLHWRCNRNFSSETN